VYSFIASVFLGSGLVENLVDDPFMTSRDDDCPNFWFSSRFDLLTATTLLVNDKSGAAVLERRVNSFV
jgi:hypothetical protein